MVAGGMGRCNPVPRVYRSLQQRIQRAAILECTAVLQILAFEEDSPIGESIDTRGGQHRRAPDPPVQPAGGPQHIGEARQVHGASTPIRFRQEVAAVVAQFLD